MQNIDARIRHRHLLLTRRVVASHYHIHPFPLVRPFDWERVSVN